MKSFEEMLNLAAQKGPRKIAVAVAQDQAVLTAINAAKSRGIADAVLVGNEAEIAKSAALCAIDISKFAIIDVKDNAEACYTAVELVSMGKAQLVMKGLVDTALLLKAVLNEALGLRREKLLSHVAVFLVPGYDRFIYVTDSAINIAPDLEQKKQIINNAVSVAHALGNDDPKVAVLAAVEKVNPKMQSTVDAAALVLLNQEGAIPGCVIGGPFALDNAVSAAAAKHKHIIDAVAGWADILVAPSIEAANMLYKSLVFFAKAQNAGIVAGAKAPVILTSRADSDEVKLNSIALAVLMASS